MSPTIEPSTSEPSATARSTELRSGLLARLRALSARPAVVHKGVTHSYGDLGAEIDRLLPAFAEHGIRPYDAVVLNADFAFRSIAALLALFVNRNVVVPVVTLTEGAMETITASCAPRHVIRIGPEPNADPRFDSLPEPLADSARYQSIIAAGASGLVLLSSGSTGAPKAILHNLDAIVADKLDKPARAGAKPPNILMFLLFDHIGGINSLLGALRMSATAIVPERRTPEDICGLIERHQIRLLPTSPTFLNLILLGGFPDKHDLSSLRLITYGTEPMPEELLRRVNAAFPRVRLLQTFGTSETGISATTSESSSSTFFKIDDPNVEYRIVDGELHLRTKTQFLGYLNYPSDSITEDGWFSTGDLVEQNADGYLKIRGRAKEVINVGGEKVLPLEVESILLTSPLIEDCTVYGRPNAITGQSVCVDIEPRGEMTRPELRKHVTELLAGKVEQFKVPSKINVVRELAVSERFKKKRIGS